MASGAAMHNDAEQLAEIQTCASLCLSVAVGCPQDYLAAASDVALVQGVDGVRAFEAPFLQQADGKRQLELTFLQDEATVEKLDALLDRHVAKGRMAAHSWRRTLAASPGVQLAEAWLAVRPQVESLFQAEHLPLHVAAGVLAYALALLGAAVPAVADWLQAGDLSWLVETVAALLAASHSLGSLTLKQVRRCSAGAREMPLLRSRCLRLSQCC